MKKLSLIALFALLMSAVMCFGVYAEIEVDDESYYAKFRDQDISLNVYNWGEYISDGSDDSVDVIEEFEKISGIKAATNGTVADTLVQMKKAGVDKFLNLNIATSPNQQSTINTTAAENNEKYPEMISTGSVHPDNPECVEELHRIKNLSIKAIKLHPDYQGFFIDEEKLFPIYQTCSDLELPIVFHSGWDCYSPDLVHAVPEASAKIARKFPKLKMDFLQLELSSILERQYSQFRMQPLWL